MRVRVGFPQGLLTEFYPPVVEMTPAPPKESGFLLAGNQRLREQLPLKDGSLDWGEVHLIPIDKLTTNVDDPVLARSMARFLERQLDQCVSRPMDRAIGQHHWPQEQPGRTA